MPEKLGKILSGLEPALAPAVKSCRLLSLWSQVVDERVSRNSEPVKIRNRVLYVSASTSTWAQELSFLKREIIAKFNQRAGEEAISDIRFKTAEGI